MSNSSDNSTLLQPDGPVAPQETTRAATVSTPNPLPPPVTAILAIREPRRVRLAMRAVNQFGVQSYQNRHLIIVNASGTKVTNRSHPIVEEIEVDPGEYPTVSALRNYGIRLAQGDWIVPWDDDNHSHPHRISLQMAHRREGHCVVLAAEVLLDVQMTSQQTHCAVVRTEESGIPGTIIFPRTVDWSGGDGLMLYDENMAGPGEDDAMLASFGARKIVLDNVGDFPGPMLHMSFYHGLNLKSREQFFGRFAGAEFYQTRDAAIVGDRLDYVIHVMRQYGYEIQEDQRTALSAAQS